jgi:dihydroxy-acid dehydratase
MDVEESIRGNPIDGVVLLMGCDKTTPSLLMGAASAGLPTIGVSGGPMLNGKWRGQELGSGTGVWSMSEQVRAGTFDSPLAAIARIDGANASSAAGSVSCRRS